MKIPKKSIMNNAKPTDVTNKRLEDINLDIDELDFGSVDNSDIKPESFIKNVEKAIRSSPEYRNYIGILKSKMDLTKCKFIPDVDISTLKKVGIEMHHYPLTLYDLVQARINCLERKDKKIEARDTFSIAKDVMKIHYEGKIGIVPLSLTPHELAHAGEIFIPLDPEYVFGSWKSILDDENFYVPKELISEIELMEKRTEKWKDGKMETDFSSLLEKAKVDISMSVSKKPEKIKKIIP